MPGKGIVFRLKFADGDNRQRIKRPSFLIKRAGTIVFRSFRLPSPIACEPNNRYRVLLLRGTGRVPRRRETIPRIFRANSSKRAQKRRAICVRNFVFIAVESPDFFTKFLFVFKKKTHFYLYRLTLRKIY